MSRNPQCIVYGLHDPRTGELRYVGQTAYGLRMRINGHVCDAKRRDKTRVARWICTLLRDGLRPHGVVLETCLFQEMLGDLERKWIKQARKDGARLVNLTDGGDGGLLGWKASDETRAKYRARPDVWSGRKHSDESRRLMSESCKRVWASPEMRAAQSKRLKGKTVSAAARAAKSVASKRSWLSPEYRARMRDSMRLAEASGRAAAGRLKRARTMTGRPRPVTAVAATAAACRKRIIDQHGTIYESLNAAALALGISPANISTVVHGKRPHTKGFVFRFYDARTETAA